MRKYAFMRKDEVEEVDRTGYKCDEEGREKLYRIWMKVHEKNHDNLF